MGLILQEKGQWSGGGGDVEEELKPGSPWGNVCVFMINRALCSSCVSPGGTGGQKLAQLPELASAEMSLHAIYLHQVSRGGAKKRRGGRRQLNKVESVEGAGV